MLCCVIRSQYLVTAAKEVVEAIWKADSRWEQRKEKRIRTKPAGRWRDESVQNGNEEAFEVAAALGFQSVLQSDIILLQVHVLHRLQVQLLVGGEKGGGGTGVNTTHKSSATEIFPFPAHSPLAPPSGTLSAQIRTCSALAIKLTWCSTAHQYADHDLQFNLQSHVFGVWALVSLFYFIFIFLLSTFFLNRSRPAVHATDFISYALRRSLVTQTIIFYVKFESLFFMSGLCQ